MHWAERIADELIKAHPERQVFTCASGITPSGPVHVGNLRDVMTVWFVARCLQDRGKTVNILHSWDDFDRFRKVPKGVPESFKEFLGKPVTDVPDPGGKFESFARLHEAEFESSLADLGIAASFRYQTQMYRSGVYGPAIVEAVRARRTIYDIISSYRTQKGTEAEREAYLPIEAYCAQCDRDETGITLLDESQGLVSYKCSRCGHSAEVNLHEAENIKLPWKVDWAMRWRHEDVVFEPGGKDHGTAGGSYYVAGDISRQVFDFAPPFFQTYEFIGLKGFAGKMSSSSGDVITPREALAVYEPEVLLWIFAKTPPTRAFDLAVDKTILQVYDEFDKSLNAAKEKPDTPEAKSVQLALLPGREVHPASFKQLASFSSIVHGNRRALEGIIQRLGIPWTLEQISDRLTRAETWLSRYAPEERLDLLDEPNRTFFESLDEVESDWIRQMHDWLKDSPELTDEAAQKVFDIAVREGAEKRASQKRFFQIVYNLLFGKSSGPRLPSFLVAVPRDKYLHLLNRPSEPRA